MNAATRALPSGWCWAKAGELISKIEAGKSFKCLERLPGYDEVGVVKVSAVTWGTYDENESKTCTTPENENPNLFVRQGDFLFSRANTIDLVGACVIADSVTKKVMLSDKILRFHVSQGWERWLMWVLRSVYGRDEIQRLATGNQESMRNIGQARIRQIHVPLAPPRERNKIVAEIDTYFSRLADAVATLERVQRNLKRYRASVLKAAVEGRLVPTEAELARKEGRDYEPADVLLARILEERKVRWIEQEAEKGRARAEARARKSGKPWAGADAEAALEKARVDATKKYKEPHKPDTSGLPKLPEGWCWVLWSQIGFSQNGRAFPSKEYRNSGVRLLRPGNLHDSGRVEWTQKNTRRMPEHYANKHPDYLVEPGQLVINLTAQSLRDEFLGRVCITGGNHSCLLNQRIARLTPILVNPRYLLWMFKSKVFRRFVDSLNTGSLIQHMFTSQLDSFVIPLPPQLEQVRIAAEVERLLAIAEANANTMEISSKRAAVLRQSILKWAFEGKLVDQDPNDEPASVLLDRIKAEREAVLAAAKTARTTRGKRKKKSS